MIDSLERSTAKLRKAIRELHHREIRDERGEFLVEGPHACLELVEAGVVPHCVVIADDAAEEIKTIARECRSKGSHVVAASASDLERLVTTRTAQGILMVAAQFVRRSAGARVVALDGVSDPGNVGTIIRTAAWFGCSDVVLSNDCADVYNPKVVRSTAGALVAVNLIRGVELADFLSHDTSLEPLAAVVDGGMTPEAFNPPERWCLVVGSEAHGVSHQVLGRTSHRLTIPRSGHGVESLNAAVAASILLYELTCRR